MNNKTELKEKEFYEAPSILDIKPVSVACQGDSPPAESAGDGDYNNLSEG